ncbi:polycystin-1-like protein 2 [Amphiura filiformis]|uniref:polycystin-1-like protein 2 n=1 Tax=Amphiura filiformis TaxID=82378 RepID=UPI003B20ECE2
MELMKKQMNDTSTMIDKYVNETELQDRTRKARNVTMSALSALKDVQSAVLHNKVPGETATEFDTDFLTVLLARQENWQLDGLELKSKEEDFMFQLPDNMHELIGIGSDGVIDTQIYHFKNNPYFWASDSDQVTSQVIGLQFTQADQSEVPINNLPDTIDLYLVNPNASSSPILPTIHPVTNQTLYAFNWTNSNASVLIQVDSDYGDSNDLQPEIEVCIQFESPPNATHNVRCKMLPQVKSSNFSGWNGSDVSPYSWLLNPDDVSDFGVYYFTVKRLQNLEDLPQHVVYAFEAQCIYWDDEQEDWKGDGCRVGAYTSLTHTHCQCNHLTFFALSLFVLPNAANLVKDAILFLSFLDNPSPW